MCVCACVRVRGWDINIGGRCGNREERRSRKIGEMKKKTNKKTYNIKNAQVRGRGRSDAREGYG